MEEILEQQWLSQGWAFVTFSTIEKALPGHKKAFMARLPYVVQALSRIARKKIEKHFSYFL